MKSIVHACLVLFALFLVGAPAPREARAEQRIAWSKDFPTALANAKQSGRVLMVCVNAKRVDGREEEERAAKGLREVVYKDERIVARSRDFVCLLLTKAGSVADYDELRALGIDGEIVSPQHIFISPDGKRMLVRKQYWRHGSGEPAVEALLAMMDRATKAAEKLEDAPAVPDGEAVAPTEEPARGEWIARMLEHVKGNTSQRDSAIERLVQADRDGDCTDPLIAFMPECEKHISTLWALIRALGRDGLVSAAVPISEFLGHKDDTIAANAAVSLEYIGSSDKKVISALKKLAGKTKDEAIANHAYRALGRCGRQDAGVRSLLLKKAGKAKSEFASYGPSIGLAYFEGDQKAMRGVEGVLKTMGIPGGRRGGGQNSVKRGLVSWTLASIGVAKSAAFVREELVGGLKNVQAFWVEGLRRFWETVADVCDGEKERLGEVETGVGVFVSFGRGGRLERYGAETRSLMDDARNGRDTTDFEPKGDGLLDVDGDR